jgi:predicted dehydrogenase
MWSYEATTAENPQFFHNLTPENCYYFFGTEASFTFPGLKKVFYPDHAQLGWQYPISLEERDVVRSDPYREQLKHFCQVVKGIERPRISGEDATKTLEVALAIHESGETGKPITFVHHDC